MNGTKQRIIDASAHLMRHQGYEATGVKAIVTAAQAPFGSVYHFFPGGKEQLGAETIRWSGAEYAKLLPAVLGGAPDLVSGVRAFFAGAADHLVATDYADACPIATIALEVSNRSEVLRQACAEVFDDWVALGSQPAHGGRSGRGGCPETDHRNDRRAGRGVHPVPGHPSHRGPRRRRGGRGRLGLGRPLLADDTLRALTNGPVVADQWLTATVPPSTTRCVPVMNDALGLSRKATA